MDILSWKATLPFEILPSFSLESTLEKEMSQRAKFFPVSVDPYLGELNCPGEQTGSHKSYFSLKTWQKTRMCKHARSLKEISSKTDCYLV